MRPLTNRALLTLWDDVESCPLAHMPVALLAVACSDEEPDELARLTVGQRDGLLLTLREWAFGREMASLAECPNCSTPVELSFNASDVRAGLTEETDTFTVQLGSFDVEFRLPTTADLSALPLGAPEAEAAGNVLERCVLTARREGEDLAVEALPEEVVRAVEQRMAEADPQADTELSLTCPSCAHRWLVPLDIGWFFVAEVDAWAQRLLYDVHCLARAYGWSEPDVLALSPRRRAFYLSVMGA